MTLTRLIKPGAIAALYLLSIGMGRWALAAENAPLTVAEARAVAHGFGWTFTDPAGRTLYIYPNDEKKPGGSVCNKTCAEVWPPVIAPADAAPIGNWSTVKRDDGALQWAYRGKPVYTYIDDPGPGFTFGENFGKVWHVLRDFIPRPAGITIVETKLGQTLADAHGHPLYTQPNESGTAFCADACLDMWVPVSAPWAANAFDDWSILDRKDGILQWAYKGKALFQYQGDVQPREINGENDGKWRAVVLEPPPARPSWVTYEGTDAGEMTAEAHHMTIYTYISPRGKPDCYAERNDCITSDWVPMIAAPEAKPAGDWTILSLADGTKQWGFRGHRLYTNKLDSVPGDFKGIRRGGNTGFKVLMRNGEPLQGMAGVGG